MPGSNYRVYPLSRLDPKSDLTRIVLPLMMCVNDITIAQSAFAEWEAESDPKWVRRRLGAKMYYGRILYSHVNEALDCIKQARDNPTFLRELDQCHPKTQKSYRSVIDFIDSGERSKLAKLRNMAGFHYDAKLAQRTLAALQRTLPTAISTHSTGSDPIDTYFPLGDLIVDRIVVGPAMGVDLGIENRERIDEIELRMNKLTAAFQDFAVNFLRYVLKA